MKLPLVPESTAGILTETGSISVQRRLRHRAKVQNRLNLGQDDEEKPFRPELEPYGPELWHVLAALLPSKGGEPSLVKVPIVGIPGDYHGDDNFCCVTPCLNEFWGLRDRHKSMLQFEATNQATATTNGLYYICWTADDNADPNKFLLKLLHEIVTELPIHRRFWCGDVFTFRVNTCQNGYEFDVKANSRLTPTVESRMDRLYRIDATAAALVLCLAFCDLEAFTLGDSGQGSLVAYQSKILKQSPK